MDRRSFKPRSVGWRRVEVNDGRKTECEISAWNLCAIASPKLRMGGDCILIQRRGAAHMHVRIDQSGYQKPPASVYSPCVRVGNPTRADLDDSAIANDDTCMQQRRCTLRRDQGHIFDHY